MKLHEQNRMRALRAQVARSEILRFRSYLNGSKFAGYDPRDGEPNDYIRTHEVLTLLKLIEDVLSGSFDETIQNATFDEWTISNAP